MFSKSLRFAYAFAFVFPLALAHPVSAQVRATSKEVERGIRGDQTAVTSASTMDADELRRQFEEALRPYPPSLPRVLRLDPTLLSSSDYLQPYPQLKAFLDAHPEIRHNPGYFFAGFREDGGFYRETPQDRAIQMWRSTIEGFTIGTVVISIASFLFWLIKTLVDHRRWNRQSKIQTEVHTKILDRFQSNDELLAYIQTPAGRKFLESSPINVDTAPRATPAPLGRILWSAQAGAVLTVLGAGILLVSRTTLEEVAPPLAAMGAIVVALGIGFVVSAVLAYALTRRFGLMNTPDASQESRG